MKRWTPWDSVMISITSCPRPDCGGTVGITWYNTCNLCGRGEIAARPPTASEKRSRGRGADRETDYTSGIYRIGYIPTAEELTRAIW